MDQRDKEQLVKIICYGVAIVIAYNLLIWLFRYVVTGLERVLKMLKLLL